MNIQLNPTQGDTKRGDISDVAAVDLTGKEGCLVKLTSTGFALPSATSDIAPYVLASGGAATTQVAAESPDLNDQFRAKLKGACNKGDILVLADPSTPADAGKLRAQPTTAGTYYSFAVAEENGVDGQFVKARRIAERVTTIAGSYPTTQEQ